MNRTPQEISRDSVNGRQLGYIIINTLIGSGVYVLPGLLAKGAGHDGWLLTLLITLIPIIYTLLICTFLKRSERSFADAMKDMMGKAGWIVRALYALMLTLFCIVALKTMSELIGTNMLPRTPNIIIEAVMMLCVLYAASKGMKVIGRINIVLFVCFICLAAAFILSIDKADFRNVLPISDLSGWNDPVYAIFAAMSFFIGLEVLYTLYPSVKNKDIKHIPDYLVVVMVEKDVDKRNKVYKAVDSVGYICEMKPQTTATLEKWIAGLLAKDNLKISREACDLILDKTGAGMDYIRQRSEEHTSELQSR